MKLLLDGVSAIPLWQQVADGVRRSIQTGRMHPGDRVVEMQLATELGISRNPIREALRQLQQQGILEYKPNVGTVVAELERTDARFAVEARAFLEVQAIRTILESGEMERLEPLEYVVAKMADASGITIEDAELLDEEFHATLIIASGSKMLRCIWQALDPYTWMAIAFQQSGAGSEPTAEGLYNTDYSWMYSRLVMCLSPNGLFPDTSWRCASSC